MCFALKDYAWTGLCDLNGPHGYARHDVSDRLCAHLNNYRRCIIPIFDAYLTFGELVSDPNVCPQLDIVRSVFKKQYAQCLSALIVDDRIAAFVIVDDSPACGLVPRGMEKEYAQLTGEKFNSLLG